MIPIAHAFTHGFSMCENADTQISLQNGFTPLRICIWLFKAEILKNTDPQSIYIYIYLFSFVQ